MTIIYGYLYVNGSLLCPCVVQSQFHGTCNDTGYGGARWLARALSYRAWLKLTPSGRREAAFDEINDIETEGYISREDLMLPADSIHYAPIKPQQFFSIVSKLKIDRRAFTFIDVGCGKGRPLLLAESMGFAKIIGVELSAKLTEIARKNTERFGAQIIAGNAPAFQFPAEQSVVFLFNPFWSPTIDEFADNLSQSLAVHPRELYVVYVNPFCEVAFERQSNLNLIFRVPNYYAIYQSLVRKGSTPASPDVEDHTIIIH